MHNILHNIVLFTVTGEKIKVNYSNCYRTGFTLHNNNVSYYVIVNEKTIYITKNSFKYLQKRCFIFDQLYKYKDTDYL